MAKRARTIRETKTFVSWEEAMEGYLLWKRAEGKAPRTVRDYRYHISWFFERCTGASLGEEGRLRDHVLQYMSEPAKPAYYNLKLASLKCFFTWCVGERYLSSNPAEGLKRRRAEERIVHMEVSTLQDLLALPDQSTFVGLRDYALLLLQLDTGIRPSEALKLRPDDVDIKLCEVKVRAENAKARRERILYISPPTVKAITHLIRARLDDWSNNIPLLCSYEGRPLISQRWYKRLSAYGERLGIKVCPYDLRHTFAVEFLRNGGNSFALQRTMGHADMNMTRRYVALTSDDLREQHASSSPVGRLVRKTKRVVSLK